MSIKDIFEKHKNLSTGKKDEAGAFNQIESVRNLDEIVESQNEFEPPVVFVSGGASYAKFGSAEKYFIDSFSRILRQYPYDGAEADKQRYHNQSTYLDRYVFENKYPTTTG